MLFYWRTYFVTSIIENDLFWYFHQYLWGWTRSIVLSYLDVWSVACFSWKRPCINLLSLIRYFVFWHKRTIVVWFNKKNSVIQKQLRFLYLPFFYLFGLSPIRVICSVTGFSSKVDKSTHYLILIGLILTIVLYTLKTSVYMSSTTGV
jgi:hypothetical protein